MEPSLSEPVAHSIGWYWDEFDRMVPDEIDPDEPIPYTLTD
jgi:hypothetical protein